MANHEQINPYRALGVSPDANDSEIREAYRKIAKKHHPDVSGCPGDSAQFRAATDAYELLSDIERKCAYDEELAEPNHREPTARASGARYNDVPWSEPARYSTTENRTLEFAAVLSQREAMHGGEFEVSIPVPGVCPACHGSFVASFFCSYCHGAGYIERSVPIVLRLPRNISHGTVLRMPLGARNFTLEVTVLIRR